MKNKSRINLVKIISIGIVSSIFLLLIFAFEIKFRNYRNKSRNLWKLSSFSWLPNQAKTCKNIENSKPENIGRYIVEGCFTNKNIYNNIHHSMDDDNPEFHKELNGDKNIWIMGDSWVYDLKRYEKEKLYLTSFLNEKAKSLRIMGAFSWSPLIMNLIFRQKVNEYNEIPDILVIFLDQTDIGDDYCRYRPYVIRDNQRKLLGVTNNNNYEYINKRSLNYFRIGESSNSGFEYFFKWMLVSLTNRLEISKIPGITSCEYQDILPYQRGDKITPNGTIVYNYIKYFKKNISNFVLEAKATNPDIKIILVSHDWAQHHLTKENINYMPNNISNVISSFSIQFSDFVEELHISLNDYPENSSLEKIFKYPKDIFSHLQNPKILSEKIGKKIYDLN